MRGGGDRLKPVPAPLRNPGRAEIGTGMPQGVKPYTERIAEIVPYIITSRDWDAVRVACVLTGTGDERKPSRQQHLLTGTRQPMSMHRVKQDRGRCISLGNQLHWDWRPSAEMPIQLHSRAQGSAKRNSRALCPRASVCAGLRFVRLRSVPAPPRAVAALRQLSV